MYPLQTIQGKEIKFVKVAKVLGMYYDQHLSWAYHIEDFVKRCNQDPNLIKSLKGTQWGADQQIAITL